jgi:transaldolase/glucose-6-phosphate isomerase
VLGEAALAGRDKLTLLADPELAAVGSWVEQLVAESSGKNGVGIVPVDLEPECLPGQYSSDRLFVYLKQSGALADFAAGLRKAGHPVIELAVAGEYDLGGEFFRWEYATAAACAILKVNAFDQPDVQDSKNRTAQKIASFRQSGRMEEGQPAWQGSDGVAFGTISKKMAEGRTTGELIEKFMELVKPGDYVAINAYLPRNSVNFNRLQKLRKSIQRLTGCATTLGFGPRFLHSTGQLHKGGPDHCVFVQLTMDARTDMVIPEEGISFATLERAQALGDLEALQARGRRVIRVNLNQGAFPLL